MNIESYVTKPSEDERKKLEEEIKKSVIQELTATQNIYMKSFVFLKKDISSLKEEKMKPIQGLTDAGKLCKKYEEELNSKNNVIDNINKEVNALNGKVEEEHFRANQLEDELE